jgi:hypothetical protein
LFSFSYLLVATISNPLGRDFDLSVPCLFSLVVVVASDPLGRSHHLDHHLPYPFSLLQLFTILVVVILILVILILYLLWL